MHALVGYDSSDEESIPDKTQPQQAKATPDVRPTSNGGSATQSSHPNQAVTEQSSTTVELREIVIGPMLEPAATMEDVESRNSTPSSSVPEILSERQTIRHLTQAPVPMSSMPPSPPGSPDPGSNARFARFLELKARNVHFNEDLAAKSSFRNPSLLSTMMARVGIDEQKQYHTLLPLDLWDPTGFPEWAYKEGLHKSQQELRDQNEVGKKLLSVAGKRTIEFTSGVASGSSSQRSTPGRLGKRRRG